MISDEAAMAGDGVVITDDTVAALAVDPTVPVAQGTPVVTTTAEPVEPAK